MAKNDRPKSKNLKVKGIARYPKTHAPYKYDNASKKSVLDWDNGKFQLEVVVSADAAAPLMSEIKAAATEAGLDLDEVRNWPYKPEKDAAGKKTGNVIFKATQYGKAKDGTKRKIAHYDAKAQMITGDFRLTGGSTVIMAARTNPFTQLGGGVSLYLDAVQVLKYAEYAGNNPFSQEEGDFEYEGDGEANNGFADESNADEAETNTKDPTQF